MTRSTPQERIIVALRALDLALERSRSRLAHEHGITIGDTLILSDLLSAPAESLRPGQLTKQLGFSSGTVTAMLDRLEQAELVCRTANPRDRRSVLIQLTVEGRRVLVEYVERLGAAINVSIPGSSQATFGRHMEALTSALDSSAMVR